MQLMAHQHFFGDHLQDVLRKEWRFSGHIVGNECSLEELCQDERFSDREKTAALAIKAGVDVLLMSLSLWKQRCAVLMTEIFFQCRTLIRRCAAALRQGFVLVCLIKRR